MSHDIYLLVEGEPLLTICREWRERYITARKAAFDYAKKTCGIESFFSGFNEELIGLPVCGPVPAGWRLLRQKKRSIQDRIVPAKGEAGDSVRAEIAALPPFPRQQEIADAIGHPLSLRYSRPNGDSGYRCMGHPFAPVRLSWADQSTFILTAPDAAAYVAEQLERHPDSLIEHGNWIIPFGFRVISEAEKEFIFAKAKFEAEKAAVA